MNNLVITESLVITAGPNQLSDTPAGGPCYGLILETNLANLKSTVTGLRREAAADSMLKNFEQLARASATSCQWCMPTSS